MRVVVEDFDNEPIAEWGETLEDLIADAAIEPIVDAAKVEAERLKLWRYWRERGMNFLVRREHSEVELRQKLRLRECPADLLEEIIAWFYERKYLSLERFAYSYAKNRADLGYGPIKIRYELSSQHQVSDRDIGLAFEEIDWGQARATAERKIRQTDPVKYRAALYRRGFSYQD